MMGHQLIHLSGALQLLTEHVPVRLEHLTQQQLGCISTASRLDLSHISADLGSISAIYHLEHHVVLDVLQEMKHALAQPV